MTFDLEGNGISEEKFRANPAWAMRTMFRRAENYIDGHLLIMKDDAVCTPMGQPIARLSGWPAPTLDLEGAAR